MVEQDRNLSFMNEMKQLDPTLMHPVESMFSFSKNNHSSILKENTSLPRSESLKKSFEDNVESFHAVPPSPADSFLSNLTQQQNWKPIQKTGPVDPKNGYGRLNPHQGDHVPGETWMKPDNKEEPLEDFLHRLISKNATRRQHAPLLSSSSPPPTSFCTRPTPSYLTSSSDIQYSQHGKRDFLKEKRNAEATFALKHLLRISPSNSLFCPSKQTLVCHSKGPFLTKESDHLVSSCAPVPDVCFQTKEYKSNVVYEPTYTKPFHNPSLSSPFPDVHCSEAPQPYKEQFSLHSSLDKSTLESFFNKVPFKFQETSFLNPKLTPKTPLQDAAVNMKIQGASIPLFSYETSSTNDHHPTKNSNSSTMVTEKLNKSFYDTSYPPNSNVITCLKKNTLSPFFPPSLLPSDSYCYPLNGTMSRVNPSSTLAHGRRKFVKPTAHSTDMSCHPLYNLSLCFPITLPYGKIHVTKASGENFYSFTDRDLCPDETIRQNASLLFSPVAGLCDAWATFLHIQAGFIQNVKADDIQRLVDLFHIVMNSDPTPHELFKTPLKLTCKGVQPHQSKDQTYWKFKSSVSDSKLQTYAFLQDSKAFQQFLFLKQKLILLKDAINAVYNPNSNLTLFTTTLFNAITSLRQATFHTSHDALTFATLFDPFNTPDEQLVKDTIQLPILIREYGQVENRQLEERFLKDKDFVETHQVPNVEISELRIEHQSKKMVDPRFRDNFVLTRQMAGDENPRKWTTQKDQNAPFHNKSIPFEHKNKATFNQEIKPHDCKKVDGFSSSLPTNKSNNSILNLYDTLSSLPKTTHHVNVTNPLPETNVTCCPTRSVESVDVNDTTEKKTFIPQTFNSTNSIGRYQFCVNADVPLIEIAYRDAKDCLSSTHGFIYMRHLMAQKQSHS